MIPVNVAYVSLSNMGFVVFLKGTTDKRTLPIFIGAPEAQAIAVFLDHIEIARPLTHDLLKRVMDNLECRMKSVEICDLKENTFYAKMHMEYNGMESEIDARPSDAIALALRCSAPVYVAEKVMEAAGVILDHEAEKKKYGKKPKLSLAESLKQQITKAVEEERYEDAATLRDKLKHLTNTNC